MSLNTAHANGGVLIYAGERILLFYDRIEMAFENKNVTQFNKNMNGRIYLTSHRVIFNSSNAKDALQSFSIPFRMMREVELQQPTFGANYIKGTVLAEGGGNWDGTAKFKMWFKSGGAIEFGQAMLHAAKMAARFQPEAPPVYYPPQGPYYASPPTDYCAPSPNQYGWIPYQTFPSAPPDNTVFTTQAPPPYPGIDPTFTPTCTARYLPGQNVHGKERAEGGSAYYNNNSPNCVYVPPNELNPHIDYMTPTDPPPPYSSIKKNE